MSAAAALLPRPNTAKRTPPLGSHVSHTFAFTPKAKHNGERGPVLLKIHKPAVRLGTAAASQLMQHPNNAKWRLRHPHRCKLFLPQWITRSPLSSLCYSRLLMSHTHTLRLQSFTFCSKHVKGEFTLHISLFIRQEQPWTSDRTGPCLRRNKEVRGRINSQRCRVACFCTRQKNALKAVTNV